ncbi:hypothetical protein GF312_13965 [Candidatus Poribacteria bacterium]|nr:hypothetical protein [Candidatus Poribacteria bacterium]
MKPRTLLVLTFVTILGEVMWMYLALQSRNHLESLLLFVIGILMGSIGGRWTSRLWDRYYVLALMRKVKMMKTSIGKQSTIFTVTALGVPMIVSFALASRNPLLPILQSYIFGFICGMNVAIYSWAKSLPE